MVFRILTILSIALSTYSFPVTTTVVTATTAVNANNEISRGENTSKNVVSETGRLLYEAAIYVSDVIKKYDTPIMVVGCVIVIVVFALHFSALKADSNLQYYLLALEGG